MQQTLKHSGKELSQAQLDRITKAQQTENPLFLKIVLNVSLHGMAIVLSVSLHGMHGMVIVLNVSLHGMVIVLCVSLHGMVIVLNVSLHGMHGMVIVLNVSLHGMVCLSVSGWVGGACVHLCALIVSFCLDWVGWGA